MGNQGTCPLCGNPYKNKHHRTSHHLFPKWWYKDERVVTVCRACHNDFNQKYPMIEEEKWALFQCIDNWFGFCKSKGKEPTEAYPELKTIKIKSSD